MIWGNTLGVDPTGGGYFDSMGASPSTYKISHRHRWTPTSMQLQILESIYEEGSGTPKPQRIEEITLELSQHGQVMDKNVYNWFQNRRARSKRKQPQAMTTTTVQTVDAVAATEERSYGDSGGFVSYDHILFPSTDFGKILKYNLSFSRMILIIHGLIISTPSVFFFILVQFSGESISTVKNASQDGFFVFRCSWVSMAESRTFLLWKIWKTLRLCKRRRLRRLRRSSIPSLQAPRLARSSKVLWRVKELIIYESESVER